MLEFAEQNKKKGVNFLISLSLKKTLSAIDQEIIIGD